MKNNTLGLQVSQTDHQDDWDFFMQFHFILQVMGLVNRQLFLSFSDPTMLTSPAYLKDFFAKKIGKT
ncbi:hypothetical protein EUGRSUZ_G01029 [Eucalyptus grandis]|uniref:Uncharacterized protein n=2 Tax=Eucalyptus grandis TaxID=71139 RepID=A0ACC3K1F5_EUCGR|nr:hypothetical protein EUGRSUZ_G01029 [Eucalyptus grandis]